LHRHQIRQLPLPLRQAPALHGRRRGRDHRLPHAAGLDARDRRRPPARRPGPRARRQGGE
ncbi:hypothetical protein LTR53_020539, partial [Teratosphaeriaceae sp. CCFEE 6253]